MLYVSKQLITVLISELLGGKISLQNSLISPSSAETYKYYLSEFVQKIQNEGACREIRLVLYLSQDTSHSAVFFIHTSTGSALGGILYFELLLSQYCS